MSGLDKIQEASRAQFDRQSANYGRSHILSQTADIRSALSYFTVSPGEKLLDVATGGGHAGIFFAKLGMEATLSDLSASMLENASRLAKEDGLTVQTRQHQAEQFPYEDASFDLVSCRVAAHHFSSPGTFVLESARVLKPGGHFLLIDGTVEDGHPEAEEWSHLVEKLRDPSHNRFITPLQWTELCHHAGLEIVHWELQPFKQPDLEWYFQAASTSAENREKVLGLVSSAPQDARDLFKLNTNDEGKITWWWQRLVLVARKNNPRSRFP